ncbi:MAG: hypothetical protein ACI8XG_000204 [Congregibacter sp.]|jgi:hypothetical protein
MSVGLAIYSVTALIVLPLVIGVLLTALATWVFSGGKQYKNMTANKVLLHLNREFSECEESAELILRPSSALTTLQQLQKVRIQPQVDKLLCTQRDLHLPKYSCKPAILLSALVLITFTLIEVLPSDLLFKVETVNTQVIDEAPKPSKLVRLETKNITITAPSYTGLAVRQTTDLNIELMAGSTVTWQLHVNGMDNVNPQNNMFIMLPNKQRILLIKQVHDDYLATATLSQSGIYYIAADEKMLGDIHTIAVTADTRPNIRFIAPTETITELAKNAVPKIQTTVSIEDDFGLGRVEIMASIASGYGEAVKFRDQTFQFDSKSMIDGKVHFFKNWDLTELGMQPGDELYFSIKAWDNRSPVAQQSRSASKIIRWLEEEQKGVLVDGLLIDFMPEYFKSQRQVIIETKELLANKSNITLENFNRTSRDLGTSQNFLKQKYGQFLGDEFNSGTLQSMEAGPDIKTNIEHDEHQEHANKTSPQPAAGHEHASAEDQSEQTDKSGYSQIIQQFGHAHGEADDGNFIKKGLPSPKLLMKRAIANMWQAELHLLLSEPELALPFENKALAFLNRAKKADRIYVKRLGFEPPPVSEKRRYQGDLSDILSYQHDKKTSQKNTPIQSIISLLNILNQISESLFTDTITTEQRNILEQVKAYFSAQLTVSPKDMTFIATLEKIQQTGSFKLDNCKDCINALLEKLWQAIPIPVAAPTAKQLPYSNQNDMLQKYQLFLQQQLVQQHKSGTRL